MDQVETSRLNRLTAPPIPGLTFEPVSHTYAYNGVVLPSVTQILAPITDWSFLSDEDKAWYADRGTAVHTATALDDLGDLVEESVHESIRGYLESWRGLLRDASIELLSVEERVCHPALGYAGTLDRRALVNKRHAVIDIKAGVKLASHGVQVHGYKRAWNHWPPKLEHIQTCYTAYLQKDGKPAKLEPWTDTLHDQQFVALLTNHFWEKRYATRSQ